MRAIRTFILRLLADPAEPEALRGDLRLMPEGEPLPFANEAALLELLQRALAPTGEIRPSDQKDIEGPLQGLNAGVQIEEAKT